MATQLEGARLLLQRARAPRRAARHAARRSRPRWRRPRRTSRPSSCATRRSSCSAATASAASTPSSASYRDIRGLCIGAGTVEIQRNFIGSQVLRGATTERAPAGATRSSDAAYGLTTVCAAADVPAPRGRGVPRAGRSVGPPVARRARHRRGAARARRPARRRLRRRAPRRRRARGGGRRARRRAARAGVRRGDVVAWQAPNWHEVVAAVPRVLAPRRDRRPDPPPRRARPTSTGCSASSSPRCGSTADDVRGDGGPLRHAARGGAPGHDVGGAARRTSPSCCSPSGSTGGPKAALHTQRGLAYKARRHGAAPTACAATTSC